MHKDYFHASEVEPQELYCILLEHFSQAEGTKFQRPWGNYNLLSFQVLIAMLKSNPL